jgi:hypothetical protein
MDTQNVIRHWVELDLQDNVSVASRIYFPIFDEIQRYLNFHNAPQSKAANPSIPAPMAPKPTANWFAAPVGLAVADVADALAALAAEDAEELALEAAELRDAETLEAAELRDAEALDAAELSDLDVVDAPPAAAVPVAVPVLKLVLEVQVADAGYKEECQ